MPIDLTVPSLGESVTEATVANWFKRAGDAVSEGEPVLELETDKVTLEVYAPAAGVIQEVVADVGTNVEVGALLGRVAEGAEPAAAAAPAAPTPPAETAKVPEGAEPAAEPAPADLPETDDGPAVRKLLAEHNLDRNDITATGKDGRLTKADVEAHLASQAAPAPTPTPAPTPAPAPAPAPAAPRADDPREERVRMSRLRQRIAQRLKEAQNTAAMLTTFNEVDMGAAMAVRAEYKEAFEKRHGVRLGFMSFFLKACIGALKEFPAVNAEIHGTDIIYKNYYDIGIAVGTPNGLVVPVLRDADGLSFADIEKRIRDFGLRAREGRLALEELTGGTFTITNGGVYGSLMSTPILNPPQSGILGMHKIQERPMVVKGEIVARPMMYIALSYDHRIVDGAEAVSFLVRVKEAIEDPRRMLLDL